MARKLQPLCLALFLVGVAITAWGQGKSPNRIVSEKLIGKIYLRGLAGGWIEAPRVVMRVSPASRRVAFVARRGGWIPNRYYDFVVVDGKEEKQYGGGDILSGSAIDSLIFSPDSRRVAYRAKLGDKWIVVVDGKEGKPYDDIAARRFSPDSQRVAYAAKTGAKWFVVVDGKEQKPYDAILRGTPVFSPDSQRVAYAAYYKAKVGNKAVVVVDENDGKQYDDIVTGGEEGGRLVYDSPDTLHYLAVKGGEIYLVEEKLE